MIQIILRNKIKAMKTKRLQYTKTFLTTIILIILAIKPGYTQEDIWDAIISRKIATVKEIIKQNPDMINNAINQDGDTLLHYAARYGQPEIAELLIENGANINATNIKNNQTPLYLAVFFNDVEITSLLIKNGADVNIKDFKGVTTLHIALSNNRNEALVMLLIKSGSNVNVKDNNGNTPLSLAIKNGNLKLATLIRIIYLRRRPIKF
ncbi:ankyrin repeat domain-containing protein [Candidatus Parcubacteria bacterium]|nr:MAG: ankyrin repeat domain-containing protein [Candidatus Parcubacteria bacterium]